MNEQSDEAMTVAQVVGKNVKVYRKAAGMTQHDLVAHLRAAGVKWDQPKVSHVENGRRSVSLKEVIVLAAVLGVTLPSMLFPNADLDRDVGVIVGGEVLLVQDYALLVAM